MARFWKVGKKESNERDAVKAFDDTMRTKFFDEKASAKQADPITGYTRRRANFQKTVNQ